MLVVFIGALPSTAGTTYQVVVVVRVCTRYLLPGNSYYKYRVLVPGISKYLVSVCMSRVRVRAYLAGTQAPARLAGHGYVAIS